MSAKKSKKIQAKKITKPVKSKQVTKKPAKKVVQKSTVKKSLQKSSKKDKKLLAKKPILKASKAIKAAKKPVKTIKTKNLKKLVKTTKLEKNEILKNKESKAEKKEKANAKAVLAKTILTKNKEKIAAKKTAELTRIAEQKTEAQQQKAVVQKKATSAKNEFKAGDFAIYPSHGVGKIVDIEKTMILGQEFSCYLMFFEKEKLSIKIPVNSAEKVGLRHLASKSQMDEVFRILRSGIKKLKGMWSRRAQEYETKINSGDIILLAEVLRDLTRDIEDGDRSYSERIIYETAIYRLASEYSAVYGVEFEEAREKVIITAKDKLSSGERVAKKDEFDEFDSHDKDLDEDEEEDEEDEEDEDADEDYDDEDYDDKPKRKSRG